VNPRFVIVDLIAKHSHEYRHSGEPFGITAVLDIAVNASCFALVYDAGQPLEWPARYPVLVEVFNLRRGTFLCGHDCDLVY
jgi:hypothetical protein